MCMRGKDLQLGFRTDPFKFMAGMNQVTSKWSSHQTETKNASR